MAPRATLSRQVGQFDADELVQSENRKCPHGPASLSAPDPLLWPRETRFLRASGTLEKTPNCVRVSSGELRAERLARKSFGLLILLSEFYTCFARFRGFGKEKVTCFQVV